MKLMNLFLCLLLSVCISSAGAEEKAMAESFPELLQVTQKTREQKVSSDYIILRTYPDTARDDVDAELTACVERMSEAGKSIADELKQSDVRLDTGAVYFRTGTATLSFLVLSEITAGSKMIQTDFESTVYNMETGKKIQLPDLFKDWKKASVMLSEKVRQQISAAYPGEDADADELKKISDPVELKRASFVMTPARIMLTYAAEKLYPGRNAVLHVSIYYDEITKYLTAEAKKETDNSMYPAAALTFDDGPARFSTRTVMNGLRDAGAEATFFVVGRMVQKSPDLLNREQSSGYQIGSHTFDHGYNKRESEILEDRDKMAELISNVIGVVPSVMRAPGGQETVYVRAKTGLPLIHWSCTSADTGGQDASRIAEKTLGKIGDGAIVLMHDLRPESGSYSRTIVESLTKRGYLLVTVEELFHLKGRKLLPNHVYVRPGLERRIQ